MSTTITGTLPAECPIPGGCNKKNLWWKILIAFVTALAGLFGITSCIG